MPTKKHPRADLYIAAREQGLKYREIAEMYGVSMQTVAASCARHSPNHFKPYTPKQVIYPHWRRWLNENKVNRSEFARRMGSAHGGQATDTIDGWFRGERYPSKQNIDKILEITGLTYELLFQEESDEDNA